MRAQMRLLPAGWGSCQHADNRRQARAACAPSAPLCLHTCRHPCRGRWRRVKNADEAHQYLETGGEAGRGRSSILQRAVAPAAGMGGYGLHAGLMPVDIPALHAPIVYPPACLTAPQTRYQLNFFMCLLQSVTWCSCRMMTLCPSPWGTASMGPPLCGRCTEVRGAGEAQVWQSD